MNSLIKAPLYALSFVAVSTVAYGQSAPKVETPGQTAAGDYTPTGVHVGAFDLFPLLDVSLRYDDNIYATHTHAIEDFITKVSPQFRMTSDWGSNMLQFEGGADVNRYAHHTAEAHDDWHTSSLGRLDITKNANLSANIGYSVNHEDRSSPDSVSQGPAPTEFARIDGGATYNQSFNRFGLAVGVDTKRYDFVNQTSAVGTNLHITDRNRTELVEHQRVSYQVIPGYSVFVEGKFDRRDYDVSADQYGVKRDSKGYQVDSGVTFELTDLLVGDVYGGYMGRDYTDATLKSTSGYAAGVDLTWSPTGLTQVHPTLARSVEETTVGAAAGYTNTVIGVGVTHELMRNVVLNGAFNYMKGEYNGGGRVDDTYTFNAGARYKITRNYYVGADYSRKDRSSTSSSSDLKQNVFFVHLGAQY